MHTFPALILLIVFLFAPDSSRAGGIATSCDSSGAYACEPGLDPAVLDEWIHPTWTASSAQTARVTSASTLVFTLLHGGGSAPQWTDFGIYSLEEPSRRKTIFGSKSEALGRKVYVLSSDSPYAGGFGFFAYAKGGALVLSEDERNPGGEEHVRLFAGDGESWLQLSPQWAGGTFATSEALLAFEMLACADGSAFDDLIVHVAGIDPIPVPEATTAWLVLASLAATAAGRRRTARV
jgi:hypothetical protein